MSKSALRFHWPLFFSHFHYTVTDGTFKLFLHLKGVGGGCRCDLGVSHLRPLARAAQRRDEKRILLQKTAPRDAV